MATIYDINGTELVNKAGNELKKVIKKPEWAGFVKTGAGKQRAPYDSDWWYKRAGSVLRAVYMKGPIGTNKLKMKYSNKKNRGYQPEITYVGSGKIIRVILQDLEKAGLIKQVEVKKHKGRAITPKGKSFLDKLAKKHEKIVQKPFEKTKEESSSSNVQHSRTLQGKEVLAKEKDIAPVKEVLAKEEQVVKNGN